MVVASGVRSIAVVGHKGAGKTALVAAMAYVAGVSPRLTKAGEYGLGLDDTPEEKAHLATFETRVVSLPWNGARVQLLDTPGETGFFADAELALAAADAVLLVVSARAGVEATTHRLIRSILAGNKPCFVAVSRCDEEQIRVEEVVEELRELEEPITLVEVPHHRGKHAALDGVVSVTSMKAWVGHPEGPQQTSPDPIPGDVSDEVEAARAQVVDDVACTDDTLADHYLEDGDLSAAELSDGEHRAVARGTLVPVFFTSSTVPFGIVALLDALVELAPTPAERGAFEGQWQGQPIRREPSAADPLCAMVFKTKVDAFGKSSYLRVVSGTLRPDSRVVCAETGEHERVGPFALSSYGPKDASLAGPGEIVVVSKLKSVHSRSTLCDAEHPVALTFPPKPVSLFSRTVVSPRAGAGDKVAQALRALEQEDTGLSSSVDETSHELVVAGLGAVHLDVTLERLRRRTKLDLHLGSPRVEYRETLSRPVSNVEGKQKKQSGGHGQFAVVVLDVEPLERGAGFVFEDGIVGGAIPRQFIGSVRQGVERAMARGVLAGFPVVDVKVRLTDGKHHSVDSSDAAFQMAGYRGFLEAARSARPVLLEPIAKLSVVVPIAALGDVLGDLSSHRGAILGQEVLGEQSRIEAHLPFAELENYEPALSARTQGRGRFEFGFDHYAPVSSATQEEVVAASGFQPDVKDD